MARETTQKRALEGYAAHFETEAMAHRTASRIWLGATAAAATIVGWLTWENYTRAMSAPEVTASATVQIAVAKVVLFSFAFSAVVWCGRIYRSHRHNYVVNRHRQNALSSFEAFATSTDDPQTKNAVLLQATSSIFAPQHTGFVSGDTDGGSQPQFVELIRTLAPAQKG